MLCLVPREQQMRDTEPVTALATVRQRLRYSRPTCTSLLSLKFQGRGASLQAIPKEG